MTKLKLLSRRSIVVGLSCMAVSLGAVRVLAFTESPMPAYRDVLSALQSGKTVKVLTDLDHCATAAGKAGSAVQSGLQISAFMVVPDKGIFFSDVHPTLDGTGQPVTEYIRYNLRMDGNLTLAVTRQTTAGVVKQDPLVCPVPAGARFVW
jgi:hypothetical protein